MLAPRRTDLHLKQFVGFNGTLVITAGPATPGSASWVISAEPLIVSDALGRLIATVLFSVAISKVLSRAWMASIQEFGFGLSE